ncbi:MAG: RNA polymerase sigma factor [Microgenomates group bacterium GW2011_GWF2_47_9]|nr:MAG: RNA polymerase sigma factor [Microgenomates group bacterium GW2011_GWF2_47_9]
MSNPELAPPIDPAVDTLIRHDDLLGLSLRDALETPPLTPLQEMSLGEKVMAGDRGAFEYFVRANMWLVVKIAQRHAGKGDMPVLDLIQEGSIGLLQAVNHFNPKKGKRFSASASAWINTSIALAIRKQGSHSPPLSLDEPIDNDEGRVLGEMLQDKSPSPEVETQNTLLLDFLVFHLASLNPRQRQVLELRYGVPNGETYTLEEVGEKLGVTKERARQIEAQALGNLRRRFPEKNLEDLE